MSSKIWIQTAVGHLVGREVIVSEIQVVEHEKHFANLLWLFNRSLTPLKNYKVSLK